jgi:hypothetical protein
MPPFLPAASNPNPLLESLSRRALLVSPVRVALGLAGLVPAAALAAEPEAARLAFLVGAFALLVGALADPRSHFHRLREEPPEPPVGAAEAGAAQLLRAAVFPSTVGVSLLVLLALPLRPDLAAFLAGSLAGMGLASLVHGARLLAFERANRVALYAERGSGTVYARAR